MANGNVMKIPVDEMAGGANPNAAAGDTEGGS